MSFKIKNLTDSNKRIALKANQNFSPSVEGETNVSTILTNNSLSFCLSENVDNTISCVGATNSVILVLALNPNYTVASTGFLFEVDGVQEVLITAENESNFETFIAKFPNLDLRDEEEIVIRNRSTTQNLRLKMKGYPLDQDAYTLSFTNNSTSSFDNGWATVCLSPILQAEIPFFEYNLRRQER